MIVASMSVAFAAHGDADDKHTLTITPVNTVTGHTYEAYQIFKGNLNASQTAITGTGNVQLNDIAWGDNVDGTALINALEANATLGTAFANCNDAADVAAVLATFTSDDANMRAFAAALAGDGILKGTPKTGAADAGAAVVIEDLTDGYYFIKDANGTQDGENGSYTRFVLRVVGNTEVTAKDVLPSIDKVIVEDDNDVHTSNGSIGDQVNYKVTGTVPNMDGYESYLYKITDTMTNGLTFNDDINITVNGTQLQEVKESGNKFYPVTEQGEADTAQNAVTAGYVVTRTDAQHFEVSIINFIQYNTAAAIGSDIVVTYSATINENAVLDENHNDNTAQLIYSNNPNESGKGENGEPKTTNPHGEGPDKTVTTYTTAVEILKFDDANSSKLLDGAVFTLTGDAVNVTIVKQGMFVEDTHGEWYLLKNGTYTKTAPGSDSGEKDDNGDPILVSSDDYMDASKKYSKVEEVTLEYNDSTNNFAADVTGTDGEVGFKGLGKGLYTLTETQAPTGYNLLTNPIYIYIDFERDNAAATVGALKAYKYKDSATAPTIPSTGFVAGTDWTAMSKNSSGTYKDYYHMDVPNNSGSTLPSTGGMGTTILYIGGSILVLAAAILLITKRRMNAQD